MNLFISRERSDYDDKSSLPPQLNEEVELCMEVPWDATLSDYIQPFVAFLIALGFAEETIQSGFADYLENTEYLEITNETEEDA